MSQDITVRLREVTGFLRFETGDRHAAAGSLPEEAAHEIERLRAALAAIAEDNPCQCHDEYVSRGMRDPDCPAYSVGDDARAALGEKPACRTAPDA